MTNFAPEFDDFLKLARSKAESLMTDYIRVWHEGDLVTDENGFTSNNSEIVYEGAAKSQAPSGWSHVQTGESDTAVGGVEFHLPFAASANVRLGDIVEVIEASDPARIGRRFAIASEFTKTFASARRFSAQVIGR